jgi:putative ATP-binding cassette transporter
MPGRRRLGTGRRAAAGGIVTMPNAPEPGLNVRRLVRLAGLFVRSPVFPAAAGVFALLMVLLASQTFITLRNNKILSDIFTAIDNQDAAAYSSLALFYLGFYVLLTGVDVTFRFFEERLSLLLRRGLTQHLIDRYLGGRSYLRLLDRPEVDNPDQRISEDVRTLTGNALSFLLIVVRAVVYLIAFSAVLKGITPRLVWAALAYSVAGSVVTLLIGKRLVRLNINQIHKEANLRFELVRTRENAQAIALEREEGRQRPRLLDKLADVIANYRLIITRNAFLGLATTGFNYLIFVIPILIVAPLILAGQMPLGKLAQSVDAFRYVVNAFAVLITEFPRLTLLTAVIARLGELVTAMAVPPKRNGLVVEEDGDVLAVESLALTDPGDGHRYFAGMSFEVVPGEHLLIVGRPGSGKSELALALAGLWPAGFGKITRPPLDRIAFVPPEPYLTPGSLRHVLAPDPASGCVTDEGLHEALGAVGLEAIAERVGGLETERDWNAHLSLNERQALALARLLVMPPKFAVLDEVVTALDAETRESFYQRLVRAGVTIITLAPRRVLPEFHRRTILLPGGSASQAPTAA